MGAIDDGYHHFMIAFFCNYRLLSRRSKANYGISSFL